MALNQVALVKAASLGNVLYASQIIKAVWSKYRSGIARSVQVMRRKKAGRRSGNWCKRQHSDLRAKPKKPVLVIQLSRMPRYQRLIVEIFSLKTAAAWTRCWVIQRWRRSLVGLHVHRVMSREACTILALTVLMGETTLLLM